MAAMHKLQAAGKRPLTAKDSNALLRMAGFSQNGRNRITQLSGEELGALCESCPKDDELWAPYLSEIQALLRKMVEIRSRFDACFGRPYVTAELASAVGKLTRLRYLSEKGFSFVQDSKMRDLLKHDGWRKSVSRLSGIGQRGEERTGRSIPVESAMRLMELYRDELLAPPRMRSRQNFNEFDLDMIETWGYGWMDDGGKELLEGIRDVPAVAYYDELPHFDNVLDWFSYTKPVFDGNQIGQGWAYLEKSGEAWHQRSESWRYYEGLISEYPEWNCAVADSQEAWLAGLPPDHPYKLVPLVTPQQLLDESKVMEHCVITYIDDCAGGYSRIFSVLDAANDQRIATAELSVRSGSWELVQLKGKNNRELIHRTQILGEPLTVIMDALVKWYNAERKGKLV